ncbi:MAG: RNA polymerase-binding protein DksA [Gammaproteobacteria bacterium]|nr:RNA polymerase-binding protein DksA [Gammaproteobacteria bacterium]
MPAAKRTAGKAKPSARTKRASSVAKARPAVGKKSSKAAPAARASAKAKARPAAKPAAKPAKKKLAAKPAKASAASRGPAKASPAATARSTGKAVRTRTPSTPPPPNPDSYEYDPNALIHGIRPYKPRSGEKYMNAAQLEHFRQVLLAWKRELMEEVDRTVHHMQDEASNFPDPNDRATQESEFGLELRTRDRERKLLKKIASALARIDDNSYGYCEETGEEIGLKRLEARPVATLCLEAQERRELAERQYGERDDRYR